MKRMGLFVLVAALVAGMSGCLFRADDSGEECPTHYCGILCDTSIDCGLFAPTGLSNCTSICTTMAIGKNDIECQDFFAPATRMSCDELGTFLFGPPATR